MFLTMVFGLMMVFTGSISAQDCVGKRPKVGDRIAVTERTTEVFRRDKPDGVNFGPWYRVCNLVIDLSEYKKQRASKVTYWATVNSVGNKFQSQVLPKGYIVMRLWGRDNDMYRFYSADKKEIGHAIAMLAIPDPK